MARWLFLLCSVAVSIACTSPVWADQSTIGYNLQPGICSNPIAIPVNNKAVVVMGTQIMPADRGEGQFTILRAPKTPELLMWAGIGYAEGVVQGQNINAGAHIMWLDSQAYVEVTTANSAHIQICNHLGSPLSPAAGYLTFVY